MAITIDVQGNPNRDNAGKIEAEATIINSGRTDNVVEYHIRQKDQLDGWRFVSNGDYSTYVQVISISNTQLRVILPFRTDMEVRVRAAGGKWGDWLSFKTRDKRFQSPGVITQLSDNSGDSAAEKDSVTYVVTNNAKATVTNTDRGATVVNSDRGYNSTTHIEYTDSGAEVVNND